jgi:hypothetical protein
MKSAQVSVIIEKIASKIVIFQFGVQYARILWWYEVRDVVFISLPYALNDLKQRSVEQLLYIPAN